MANVSEEYLIKLLRVVVETRADFICEFPNCNCRTCDPAHRWSRSNLSIRFNHKACVNLCVNHHTAELFSAHKSPEAFWKFIIESGVRSEEWERDILIVKNQIITVAPEIYREECKEKLLAELKRLGIRGWRK